MEEFGKLAGGKVEDVAEGQQRLVDQLHEEADALGVLQQVDRLRENQAKDGSAAQAVLAAWDRGLVGLPSRQAVAGVRLVDVGIAR